MRQASIVETIAVACAVVVTCVVVRREFWPSTSSKGRDSDAPVLVEGWESHLADGHWMGRREAPVTILEFGDFECPVCGQFSRTTLRAVRAKYPDQLAVVYRHWPLSYHRFAYPAARASECAGRQGRFESYHDLLYDTQDSLGLISWDDLAVRAGVGDTAAFKQCIRDNERMPIIDAGIAAAMAVGGTGTPTVLVNGKRFAGAPDSAALNRMIEAELGER